MVKLLSVKELQAKVAQMEADKATLPLKHQAADDAEKKALLERLTRPSRLSDEEVVEKATMIINRAVENGLMSVQVFRFPHHLFTDNGRAINRAEPGWEKRSVAFPRRSSTFGNGDSSRSATTSIPRSSTIGEEWRVTSAQR